MHGPCMSMLGLSGNEGLILAHRRGIEAVTNLVERRWIDLASRILVKIKGGGFACLWGWDI